SGSSRIVLRSREYVGDVSVSPDGARLAYHSGQFDQDIMNVDIETGATRPMRSTRLMESDPNFAPSGDRYVHVDFSSGRGEIVTRDSTGTLLTRITSDSPVAGTSLFESRRQPVFSPDGKRVAFSERGRIWVVPASGGQPVALVPEQYG